MKKIQKTLTAILFSTMLVAMFCSCNKSGEGVQNKLIGTWTEKNSLFTDVLTLNENGEFTFQSHLSYMNGSGNYKYQVTTLPNYDPMQNNDGKTQNMEILILYYAAKGSETLKIVTLTDKKLEMTDRYDNVYHFTR